MLLYGEQKLYAMKLVIIVILSGTLLKINISQVVSKNGCVAS